MKTFLKCALVMVMMSSSVRANEKVLIPISLVQPVPGAHGSLWTSVARAYNAGSSSSLLVPCPGWIGSLYPQILPQATYVIPNPPRPTPARFFCFEGGDLTFQLRIQDVSRQASTWGTEIPVLREPDLRNQIILVGVPTDERFRQTLRVYNWRAGDNANYLIEALSPEGTILLTRDLQAVPLPGPESEPGYAQIIDLVAQHPELASAETVTLRITSRTEGLTLWGFVSVTNNDTQHVTTITPY